MSEFLATETSLFFDFDNALDYARKLKSLDAIQLVLDAELLAERMSSFQGSTLQLKNLLVSESLICEENFDAAAMLLTTLSDSEQHIHEEGGHAELSATVVAGLGNSAVHTVVALEPEPLDLAQLSPEELEHEATKLLKIKMSAVAYVSTTPTVRKKDEGPWLRSGHRLPEKPASVPKPQPQVKRSQAAVSSAKKTEIPAKESEVQVLSGSSISKFAVLPMADAEELKWQERALCAQTDPEAFFPEKGGSTREAKRVCASCDVRVECLEYALDNDERFGIWGGLSERERRRLKKSAI